MELSDPGDLSRLITSLKLVDSSKFKKLNKTPDDQNSQQFIPESKIFD